MLFTTPSRTLNQLALLAFGLGLVCLLLPGSQILAPVTPLNLLISPLGGLAWLQITGLWSVLMLPRILLHSLHWLLTGHVVAMVTDFLPALTLMLWLGLVWVWGVGFFLGLCRRNRIRWRDWLVVPLLFSLLALLSASQIPAYLSFRLHQPWLEAMVNQPVVTATNPQAFDPPRLVGLYQITMVFRPIPTLISILVESPWTYQGFVWDRAGPLGRLEASHYSLAPGSNNGDQVLVYLHDGWYLFQNLLD